MIHLWEWLSQKILKISRNPVQPRPHLVLRISLAANVRNLTITEIIEIQMWGISQLKPQIHVGLSLKSWIDCDLSYLFLIDHLSRIFMNIHDEYLKIHEHPIFPVFYGYCDRKMMKSDHHSSGVDHPLIARSPVRQRAMRQKYPEIPGLVNIQKTMENHHVVMGKSTINGDFP